MVGKRQKNRILKSEKNKNRLCLLKATQKEESVQRNEISNIYSDETQVVLHIEGNEINFQDELKDWYLKYRPSVACTASLLKILNSRHSNIPLSVAGLIGKQQQIVKRTVPPGSYFHIGLEQNLRQVGGFLLESNIKEIILDIGIDGLPLFKSSEVGLWPILGRIVNMPTVKVFLIGSYVGKQKPINIDFYLHDFVYEIRKLKEEGLLIGNAKIAVKIRAFLCDAPARSFVCGIKGHNSLNGCSKCEQKGVSVSRVTTFCTSVGKLRTDEDFYNRVDKNFHKEKFCSVEMLLEKEGIKMVSQFPLDIMHLVDLGAMKKMLLLIMQGKTTERITTDTKELMSSLLVTLSTYIPREFARKPRSLKEISKWKAVEFRQFILYTGLIVFKQFLSYRVFNHFIHLSCSYRILVSSNISNAKILAADEMLTKFVEEFSSIYGITSVTHNIHNLLHLKNTVREFGSLSDINAYPFENMMQSLKKSVRKPQHIDQQLFNIFVDLPLIKPVEIRGIKRNAKGLIKSYVSDVGIFLTNCADSYCLLVGNMLCKIISFEENESFRARVYIDPKNFFVKPFNSQDLGIYLVNANIYKQETFSLDQIRAKLVSLPYKNEQLLIPFVHNFK